MIEYVWTGNIGLTSASNMNFIQIPLLAIELSGKAMKSTLCLRIVLI
jgi:hypothetical protein